MMSRVHGLLLLAFIASPALSQYVGTAPLNVVDTATQADPGLLNQLLNAPYPPVVLRADDIISIQVFGVAAFSLQPRIATDGTITLPLIGVIPSAGLTPDELGRIITKRLEDGGLMTNPQVTVLIVSQPSAVVTISGAVPKPGVFPAIAHFTLAQYLSQAGGLSPVTSVNSSVLSPASPTVTLVRPSLGKPVSIPLGSDPRTSPYAEIPLIAGDEVRVSTTGQIYAVGAFKSQGSFPLKNTAPTTVMQLVALAGGMGYEADSADAHIVRVTGTGRTTYKVDVGRIMHGKAPDVTLLPDDILYVPTNQLKAAIKGGGTGLIISLATAYLYTH